MSERHPIDRALVDATLAGDTDAFRQLVERDAPLVIGVCARILHDPAEAEDVAQEAFLKAYQALATFRGDGAFGAWVTRIGVRIAVARVAARKDSWTIDDESRPLSKTTLSAAVDLERDALDLEARQALWSSVAALPDHQRATVALRFIHDLTIEEIAALTAVPAGTVKSRLHRAFDSLREELVSRTPQ